MNDLQLFAPLPDAVESALRASIRRFGVIVPVVKDQHGRTIDGHHRSRIAEEEGVKYRVDTVDVADEDQAREMARSLNADRRHLTEQQRREVVALLAAETVAIGREEVARHSPEAIAAALRVSRKTVRDDIDELERGATTKFTRPAKTLGLDGKVRPTRHPDSEPVESDNIPEKTDQVDAPAKKRAAARKPLPDAFRVAAYNAMRAAESIHRLTEDDRWSKNAPKIDSITRENLRRAASLLSVAADRLSEGEEA